MKAQEAPVNTTDLLTLRNKGLIAQEEIAILVGDILIAENVLTKERRVITDGNRVLLETSRRLLKG